MGAEAEGSGLGWGLEVGSGSGDLGHSEELLRVSVRGAWCLGGLPCGGREGEREGREGGHQTEQIGHHQYC